MSSITSRSAHDSRQSSASCNPTEWSPYAICPAPHPCKHHTARREEVPWALEHMSTKQRSSSPPQHSMSVRLVCSSPTLMSMSMSTASMHLSWSVEPTRSTFAKRQLSRLSAAGCRLPFHPTLGLGGQQCQRPACLLMLETSELNNNRRLA